MDIPIPSSSQLCERFAALQVSVTQCCEQLARRLASGEAITMIVDSMGLSLARACEWYEQKYGRKAAQTPWRKMHLSIDADMNVHTIRITTTDVSDSEGMGAVLPVDLPVNCVFAGGTYYSIERTDALSRAGVTPVIPPPARAVVHDCEDNR